MPDARFPMAGSPPGRGSQRADLSPAARFQPVRIGTGQPYGSAKQQEQMQSARPLANRAAVAGVPNPITSPQQGGGGAAGPQPTPPSVAGPPGAPLPATGLHPRDVISTLASHPSAFPDRPVTFGVPSGNPKQTSIHAVMADLEDLMARSPQVPQPVMDLYLNLRDEAARTTMP